MVSFSHPHDPYTITRPYWDRYDHDAIDLPSVADIADGDRDPHSRRARATHAWQRKPEYALARDDAGWPVESPSLADDDPMFAMALGDPAALYIEDVLSADPALVNGPYEVAQFGHRALIHAPLYHDGLMYGILEPCMIEAPRAWSDADRAITAMVQEKIAPAVADHVARHCPG